MKQEGGVIVNIKPVKETLARQRKAWDEFLDMLMERAEAKLDKEAEGFVPTQGE